MCIRDRLRSMTYFGTVRLLGEGFGDTMPARTRPGHVHPTERIVRATGSGDPGRAAVPAAGRGDLPARRVHRTLGLRDAVLRAGHAADEGAGPARGAVPHLHRGELPDPARTRRNDRGLLR